MENASKALIIAGAILLSILLISLGIMIFNQAQDPTKNSGMSQAQVSAFNNKFSKYEGKKISGSEVRGLLQEIIASNGDEDNINAVPKRIISVTGAIDDPKNASKIKTSKSYEVTLTAYNTEGYVTTIKIEEKTNSN